MRRLMSFAWTAPRRVLVALVRAYRLLLSPWLGSQCRFEPSCSRYAIAALERHGAVAGSAYVGWRLLRCNPWCRGGCDPVPDNPPWKRAGAPPGAQRAGSRAHGLFTALPGLECAAGEPALPPAEDKTLSKTPS